MPVAKILYNSTDRDKDVFWAISGLDIVDPIPVILFAGKRYVFANSLEYERIAEHTKTHPELEIVPAMDLMGIGEELIEEAGIEVPRSWALFTIHAFLNEKEIKSLSVPYSGFSGLNKTLEMLGYDVTVETDPQKPFLPERAVKTAQEIELIRDAVAVTERAINAAISTITLAKVARDGTLEYDGGTLTSERMHALYEEVFAEYEYELPFGVIVASGADAAIPHNLGSGPLRAGELIVMDVPPRSLKTGYFADVTRTVIKGEPSPEQRAVYEAVLAAQLAAEAAVKPGVTGAHIHQIAEATLEELGFLSDLNARPPYGFTHALGHGFGLDMHEAPFAGATSSVEFEVGNTITIEPGSYDTTGDRLGFIGGMRLEDDGVIIEGGFENLTTLSKDNWIIP